MAARPKKTESFQPGLVPVGVYPIGYSIGDKVKYRLAINKRFDVGDVVDTAIIGGVRYRLVCTGRDGDMTYEVVLCADID